MNPLYFFSGDGPFFFNEQIKNISWLPQVWDASQGFGENLLSRLWLDYPFRLFVKLLSTFGLPWWTIEKLLWVCIALLGFYSMYGLIKKFFGHVSACVGAFIYLLNTYALLLFDGGQLGVALAYSFAPFVLLRFINTINLLQHTGKSQTRIHFVTGLQNGLYVSFLVVFDLRLAYLVLGAIALYVALAIVRRTFTVKKFIHLVAVPLGVTVCMHAFWFIPMALVHSDVKVFTEEFVSVGMVRFLSVADLPHALSFLHPNWPENLFGKVYFLQPEFLLIPFLAFVSLLYLRKMPEEKKQYLMFFVLLVLLGAFFAKGTNGPFGSIYEWCFLHIPGFIMFRDSTKFYLFIALGYSVLIPFSCQQLAQHIHNKGVKIFLLGLFLCFWLFTIRPLFLGELSGNFRPQIMPEDYVKLKDALIHDPEPSRTLWLPTIEKFIYASDIHPVVSGNTLFKNASFSGVISVIQGSEFTSALELSGVKRVVVPIDMDQRIFLTDYAFDSSLREQLIVAMTRSGLQRDKSFKELAVFVNPNFYFRADKPAYVAQQEYWSRGGLVVSITMLLVSGIVIVVSRRRPV
jgi:hypothetical protein